MGRNEGRAGSTDIDTMINGVGGKKMRKQLIYIHTCIHTGWVRKIQRKIKRIGKVKG